MATNNSKPQPNSGSEPSRRRFGENEIGGITRHNITFSRLYKDGDQWKTTQTFGATTSWFWRKWPIRRTRGSSKFSRAATPRTSNWRRGAAARVAALHQYQAGPNLAAYTIEVPAADQTLTGLLVGADSLKTAHHALLDSQ